MDDPLVNPVPAALTGPLRTFGDRRGRAVRFDPDVSPFAGLPADPDARDWADLAALAGPGETLVLAGPGAAAPAGWETVRALDGVQMDGAGVEAAPDPEAIELEVGDRDAMRDLVERTRPGPWGPRTAELGTYLGIRRGGELVAMAGERLRVPGRTEISAVCTDPSARGQGLAERLVRAVAAGIVARGDRPILHGAASNETALRLYRRMGFVLSRPMRFDLLRTPER
ncbi:GNAT family N-acetyltransferase [Pseudonocardia sp. KRD291]|uniref:GNAT family N-acetyltransferase n=1 Tax=Pseudonocardia sp. KRD291 TaxID=2792007 RepID=UPI001C4A44D2|nr:GNAT family N-acetyltransferase [Pseudonocardia sp. KRD291]MBW0106736.1 GNAT family N-acetyltransferase [Pseudonocardia sp. KRD291]